MCKNVEWNTYCNCADVAETLCYLLIGPDQAGASQSIEVHTFHYILYSVVMFFYVQDRSWTSKEYWLVIRMNWQLSYV